MKPEIKWLDDPEVFRVNRLDAHSDHYFYGNEAEAEKGESTLCQSLNGEWQFAYSVNAASRPEEFYRMDFDWSGFDRIQVPGHIELAGYDKIHYINTMYPWEGHFYRRPAYTTEHSGDGAGVFSGAEYNPVGSYVKEFDLEEGLCGKRVIVQFEGVEQAMYLWLNGEFVGYAEDTFTPSEFDLTPYIREKGNVLAVEVHKRSSAAFLEDQDFFRFFGIFRSVSLLAKPAVHLEDLWVKPVLCGEDQGLFSMDMTFSAEGDVPFRVEVELETENGTVKFGSTGQGEKDERKQQEGISGQNPSGEKDLAQEDPDAQCFLLELSRQDDAADCDEENDRKPFRHGAQEKEAGSGAYRWKGTIPQTDIGSVEPWDNHHPKLYQLRLRIFDGEGRLMEYVPYKIGFRRIEIIEKVVCLNAKRLKINGVNRHEWNMRTGRCITMEDMRTDMEICLKNHINAVRTCHYPDQIPWYYLCDENGIYLMAETNLESHGSWQKLGGIEPSYNVPGSVPQWKGAVLDRAESNFEFFKNHPSVLFWSLGNESYAGDNLAAMNAFFKGKNDGRLTHYEGVVNHRVYEDVISDLESRMYETPENIVKYLENHPKKPFILCEYMHDMGNSLGGMGSYIKILDEFEEYCGGFIWDFIDQAILVRDEVTGEEVLRYGGDFDDRPSDYEFSGDGILFADRTEKPAMQEVRYYYGCHK